MDKVTRVIIDKVTNQLWYNNECVYNNGEIRDFQKCELIRQIYKGRFSELKHFLNEGDKIIVTIIRPGSFNTFEIRKIGGEVRVFGKLVSESF